MGVSGLLTLTSGVHPGTKRDGQTLSHSREREAKKRLTYLVYVLLLKSSPQFVFPLVTCPVAFGHLKILVRVSGAEEYQPLPGFSSTCSSCENSSRKYAVSPNHSLLLQLRRSG